MVPYASLRGGGCYTYTALPRVLPWI